MKDETKIQAHIFKKPRSLLNVSFGGTAKSTPMRKPHTVFDSTGKAQPLRKTGCFWQKLIKMMLRCDFQGFTVHIDNVLCSVAGIYNIMQYCLQFSFFFFTNMLLQCVFYAFKYPWNMRNRKAIDPNFLDQYIYTCGSCGGIKTKMVTHFKCFYAFMSASKEMIIF